MYCGNGELEQPSGFDRSARSFFGAMVGFIVLDLILLCWLLNPFSGLTRDTHAYPLVDRHAMLAALADDDVNTAVKPSPLGAPLHVAARKYSARTRLNTTPAVVEVNK